MSTLIDSFMRTASEIDGKWWVAKPLQPSGLCGFRIRLREAIQVLRGNAIAVHFKVDKP
jgi:hypothetical protein